MTEKSVSQMLADLGYGHRPLEHGIYGCRQVFCLESGDILGQMDVIDAIRFLRSQGIPIDEEHCR